MFIESNHYQRGINRLAFVLLCLTPLAVFPDGRRFNVVTSKFVCLSIISVLFFALVLIKNQRSLRLDQVEHRWLYGYVALVMISTAFALKPTLAILGSSSRKDGLITLIFYLVAYSIGRQVRIKEGFLRAMCVTTALISGFALVQFFKLDPKFLQLYPNSWRGLSFSTMGNPNFLGSYLVLALPLPMYFYMIRRKLWGLLLYSLTFFALLATRTRGAWIGALGSFLAMVFLCYKHSPNRKLVLKQFIVLGLISILLFGAFILLTDEAMLNKILALFSDFKMVITKPESAIHAGTNRFYIWSRCVELIKDRPIFGYGVENMSIAMNQRFRNMIIKDFGRFRNWDKAHNEYLNIAVSSGIPSLILYLGFTFTVLYKGIKKVKHCPLLLPIAAAALGYMIQAFFNIQMIVVYYIFMAMLGMLSSEVFGKEEEQEENSEAIIIEG